MLSESDAYAVLQQHCAPLCWASWATVDFQRPDSWPDAVREHVDFIVEPLDLIDEHLDVDTESTAYVRSLGARTYLAFRVAQAVSCCRGFEPVTHQRFWRRVALTLWAHNSRLEFAPDRVAFSPATFTHIALARFTRSQTHDAFWVGFFHGTESSVARLAAVLDQLRPHMAVGAPPPLRVSLSSCYARDPTRPVDDATAPNPNVVDVEPVVSPKALRSILVAALGTPQVGGWPTSTHLGLLVAYRIDDHRASTEETLALLAHVPAFSHPRLCITLDRLAIQLAPPNAPRCAAPTDANRSAFMTRARALGELLRRLVVDDHLAFRIPSLDVLGGSYSDFRLVGGALSAVSSVAELRCSRLCDVVRPQEKPLRLAWLAFALLCSSRRGSSSPLALALLSVGIAVTDPECTHIQQLLHHGTPLRDVVCAALHLRFGGGVPAGVEWVPFGSRVRLARATQLYFEPMRWGVDEFVAVALDREHELDWVATLGGHNGCVGVVFAGFGLVWADAASLVARQRLGQPASVTLAALTLGFEGVLPATLVPDAFRIAGVLRLVACRRLASLTLDCAVLLRDDLARVLATCPALTALSLDRCVVESAAPLVDAFRRAQPRLAVLSLRGVHDLRLRHRLTHRLHTLHYYRVTHPHRGNAPFLDALVRGLARGVLRELHVDCSTMDDEHAAVAALAHAVASPALAALTRLHVTSRAAAALLGPLCDAARRLPPRARAAALRGLGAVGCGAPEIARRVLGLAEHVVVVTWDTTQNS